MLTDLIGRGTLAVKGGIYDLATGASNCSEASRRRAGGTRRGRAHGSGHANKKGPCGPLAASGGWPDGQSVVDAAPPLLPLPPRERRVPAAEAC